MARPGGGGGGGTQVCMGTHCQTATSGSGERQHLEAVNSTWDKRGGQATSN